MENLDFELLITSSFLLPFFSIIIILKIFSFIIFSFVRGDDEDEFNKVTVFSHFIGYVVFSFSVLTIYDYTDRKQSSNFRYSQLNIKTNGSQLTNTTDDSLQKEEINNNISNSTEKESFSWDDINITKEAETLVNRANIEENYGLSSDEILKVKKILSDPDPDPMNRDGQKCSMGTKECKWCGKEIDLTGKISPSKDLLRLIVQPKTDNPLEIIARIYGTFSVNPKLCIQTYEVPDNYNRKYQCIVNDEKDFCSLKCEREFKNNRGY